MPNACLFGERMKTVKIINEEHPESCIWWETSNASATAWSWRFAGTVDSQNGGREGLLWERVSPSTAPTTSSDPETLARKYMTSPQELQRTGQLLSEGFTQNLINYASCPQVTPGSHLPDFLLYPLSHCVPKNVGCLFYYLFSCLKTAASSLHCWVAAP